MSTLDRLTRGRIGWNVVTGYLDSAARNLGLARQLAHDDRYELADEYMEVVYKLWELSWEEGAVRRDRAGGNYTDPARVHAIGHHGRHHQVPGIHLREPSPQRTPVIYRAGASARGLAFAARHAECVFVSGPSRAVVGRAVASIRAAVERAGRDADDVLVYAQALVVTAETEAAAHARHAELREHVGLAPALALLSGWTGVDFGHVPLDSTVEYIDTEAGRSALASFSQADPGWQWSVREAAEFTGLGGRGPVVVGGATQVADELEAWADETGIDGFNLTYVLAYETMRDVVDIVVPELQRRGRYAREYAAGTLRDKLFDRGPRLHANRFARRLSLGAASVTEGPATGRLPTPAGPAAT